MAFVEMGFASVEGAEMFPLIWSLLGWSMHNLKPVIIDHMELWRDVSAVQVSNEPNRLGMDRRDTDVLSSP